MRVQDFLAWLQVAELGQSTSEDLRFILDGVLDDAPEEGSDSLEDLLDEIADQLEGPEIDTKVVLAWAERFEDLLPPPVSGPGSVESKFEEPVHELPEDYVESPRLERFQTALRPNNISSEQLVEALENEMRADWEAYNAEPFLQDAASAESVAAHRRLQEGFDCWFNAFNLVRDGKPDAALASATEGNRLFKVVALWSEEISASSGVNS